MSDLALSVDSVSKQYRICVRQEHHDTLRDQLMSGVRSLFQDKGKRPPAATSHVTSNPGHSNTSSDTFWALKDVSFDVKQGEVLGIIGRNGAGKSTLLKILSRITEPTQGRIEIHGRVGSLLEIGTGFHPELSGRENIYLNGALLGMRKTEITRRFDEIVAFAEIEKFLDTPVKRYSSGMYVRLAFAVAAHFETDILIVDEVLAVGDTEFQRKCLGKMQDVANSGRTVLFVSHNMTVMQALCSRGIVFSDGRIKTDGLAQDAVRCYAEQQMTRIVEKLIDRTDRSGDGRMTFTAFWMEDAKGLRIRTVLVGEDVRFCFGYSAKDNLKNVHIAFNLQQMIGDPLVNCNTSDVGQDLELRRGDGVIVCEVKRFPLRASRYVGNLFCKVNGMVVDWIREAFAIEVQDGDFYGTGRLESQGKLLLMHAWMVDNHLEKGCASWFIDHLNASD